MSGSSYTCKLANSGNCKLQSDWSPVQYESIELQYDGTYWVELARKKQSTANLSDFQITSAANNNILYYKSADAAWENVAMTGDVTNSAGAMTIANLAVTNAKVSATAAIDYSKLAALTSGNILVGNGSNVATSVALSGDATLSNAGALSLDPSISVVTAVVSLSQSDITGLSVTPKQLIAAPGSGKLIVVDTIEFLHTYSTAVYANGGDLQVVYHGSTVIAQADEDVVNGASSANYFYKPSFYDLAASADPALNDMTALANLAVDLTNATAAFINGNAANILKVKVRYRVITLMT
jgi:hypothetical protein